MPPDDHLTRKISSVIKINGNLLTENNLNSSNAAKIASPMERKNKDTDKVLYLESIEMHA